MTVEVLSGQVLLIDQQENPSATRHAGEPAEYRGEHRPTDALTLC
jgi:hypothetical protein